MTIDPLHILSPEGPIAKRLGKKYESRPQQIQMLKAVQRTLSLQAGQNDAPHTLIVEAGTGVGKSFAYLLPVLEKIMSRAEGQPKQRIVISTHTIALQEQILEKDIPLLRAVTGEEFTAVLVKGRSNYLSIRRLQRASQAQDKRFPDQRQVESLHAIEDWAYQTYDGSLASMNGPLDPTVWDHVKSDSGNCMGRRCPHFEACFYQKARRRMENADILVVNHALFFSDLALRAQGAELLPQYDHVILDEAHTIEDVASDHFGIRVTAYQIRYLLNSLYNTKNAKGFLPTLVKKTNQESAIERAISLALAAMHATDDFFDSIQRYQKEQGRSNGRLEHPDFVKNPLSPALQQVATSLKILKDKLQGEDDQFEIAGLISRLQAFANALIILVEQNQTQSVYWIKITQSLRTSQVALQCSPIDIASLMNERLYHAIGKNHQKLNVVLTSATLATQTNSNAAYPSDPFAHVKQRLGANHAQTLILGSPFDYQKQAELILHPSMPEPKENKYFEKLCENIIEHIDQSDGGVFVLFTSYALLNNVAQYLKPLMTLRAMPLLVQGQDLKRTQMVDRFKDDRRSVLLGTDSFWQGIDVPGDALRKVIIPKLPFDVPDRPLTEARLQRLQANGKNPFVEYSLPQAILKFKQGFGRLIRSATDSGQVVVLDSRLPNKRYGQQFIRALPSLPVIRK